MQRRRNNVNFPRKGDSLSVHTDNIAFVKRFQRHLTREMARTRRQVLMVELLMLQRRLGSELTAKSAIGARDAFFKGPNFCMMRPHAAANSASTSVKKNEGGKTFLAFR